MSFQTNNYQQYSINDKLYQLTEREQKALKKSWAQTFADDLFPKIDESMFSVLYSDNDASRPNTPVNVIVGGLIIKELFDYSDDEIVEGAMFDYRIQTALHTTSFKEQPFSDKTLTRFRKRCYNYETTHGVDLFHDCVKNLAAEIAKIMKITGSLRRMDSMMIDSNIRKLSRMELIYTCIRNLALTASKQDAKLIPEELQHYLNPNDFNQMFYYQRSSETNENIPQILADADKMLELCKSAFSESDDYKLLTRCLSEQTVVEDEKRRLRTKEDGGMDSNILQNPSDPDATFREKAGKQHRGYVANMEESVGKEGTVVTDYQFEPNNTSDSQLMNEHLMADGVQKECVIEVADGAYSGADLQETAEENNVILITTALSGCETRDILADFEFNEAGTRVIRCPAGYAPKSCSYCAKNGRCTCSFHREQCENCPNKDKCKAKLHSRTAQVYVSRTSHERAKSQRFTQTEEFKNFARLRNGVETVPSYIRSCFHLEKLPRGEQRGKFFFGGKIAALNFRKLFNFRCGRGNYAQNPVIE